HLLRGRARLEAGRPEDALADFDRARLIPDNLPNDNQGQDRSAELNYWAGRAYQRLGQAGQASAAWNRSADLCPQAPDAPPASEAAIQLYFSALAHQELGHKDIAEAVLHRLLESATHATSPKTEPDAGSRRQRRRPTAAQAHYLAGVCYAGLGDAKEAQSRFQLALESKRDLPGARVELGPRP